MHGKMAKKTKSHVKQIFDVPTVLDRHVTEFLLSLIDVVNRFTGVQEWHRLVGCFEDLRRFSDLSAISRLGDNQSLKSYM